MYCGLIMRHWWAQIRLRRTFSQKRNWIGHNYRSNHTYGWLFHGERQAYTLIIHWMYVLVLENVYRYLHTSIHENNVIEAIHWNRSICINRSTDYLEISMKSSRRDSEKLFTFHASYSQYVGIHRRQLYTRLIRIHYTYVIILYCLDKAHRQLLV